MSSPDEQIVPGEGPAPEEAKDEARPTNPRRLPPAVRLQQSILYWRDRARPYHRHLSALATLLGFLGDNYFFLHADAEEMQLLFVIYLVSIAGSIILLHGISSRAKPEKWGRTRFVLPLVTQFAFGGLWSALLIFYTHSAVLAASWPFLVILLAVLIGTEVFSHYLPRLIWSSILFFFGLFCSSIFLAPVYVHAIGDWVFFLSSVATVVIFLAFLRLLNFAGGGSLKSQRFWILGGGILIMLLLNGLYFTKVLPPLPLVMRDTGVFHEIKKVGDVYEAKAEPRSDWDTWLGRRNIQHVMEGERLSVYGAVFAPTALTTPIVHRWEYYSPQRKDWIQMQRISFPVRGGRHGGYRGYTRRTNPKPGEWRVNIETSEGRMIGRVRFSVMRADAPPVLEDKVIK